MKRHPKTSRKASKKVTRFLLVSALFVFVCAAIGFTRVYFTYAKQLPTTDQITLWSAPQSTHIYDRNGTLLYEISGDQKRTTINSDQIADSLKKATIAIEDKRFYDHHGIDIVGISRALVANAKAQAHVQGASTLSQQLAKDMYLSGDKTIERKIKQILIAIKIEQTFTKDQILTMYLNQVNYGSNAYGAEAAANMYFEKSAKDLSLAESALLAALPQSPGILSPYRENHTQLIARRNTVLQRMAEQNFISTDEAAKAKAENIVVLTRKEKIEAPHFVMHVQQQLIERYGEDRVQQGGLAVTTTLDLPTQKLAEKTLTDAAGSIAKAGGSNSALVALDPKTGDIKAMVGSLNYFDKARDGNVNVATSHRPPGSAFKPIVYAAGFEVGWSPGSTLFDVETDFEETKFKTASTKPYIPKNYDGKYHGPVSIREALANSYNVPAVKMMALVGKDQTIGTAQKLGITTFTDTKNYGLSLVIGGGDVRLLEIAGAYGAFANNGAFTAPNAILKVTQGDSVIDEHKPDPKPVFRPEVAYQINSILSDAKAREPIFGSRSPLSVPGYTVAAKTGTTQDYRDAWTLGYTPNLVVGVWVGNNDFSPMKTGSAGAMAAAPIWNSFIKQMLAGKPDEPFLAPSGLTIVALDTVTGKLPTTGTRKTRQDIIATWQKPSDVQLASYQIIGCDGAVRETRHTLMVHSEKPEEPNWELPVIKWARANGYSTGRMSPVRDTCEPPVQLITTDPVEEPAAPVAPESQPAPTSFYDDRL